MKGINVGRWIAGGLAAGVLIWILEGVGSVIYMKDVQAALTAHGLSMKMDAPSFALSVLVSLIVGLLLVFFYAAARPRFGPGPGTAATTAVALWVGVNLIQLCGYHMLGLFPARLLVQWGVVGLVEMILGGILGAWIYREASPATEA